MKSLLCFTVACLVAPAALAQELTLPDLARRQDLWPAQCNLKQTISFQGGVKIAPGPMKVDKVTATEVELCTLDGKTPFVAEPNETDVLAVANAAYAKLTPKQRAITYDSLIRQKDYWPQKLALTQSFTLNDGKPVAAGEPVTLTDMQPGKLTVMIDRLKTTVQVLPQATDIIALARKLAEGDTTLTSIGAIEKATAEKQRVMGVVMGGLDGKLINPVTSKPQPLAPDAPPKYYVFFRGSSTCSITQEFAPSLIKYYQQMKPQHADVEFVYLTTETNENTAKFAKQIGFNWRTVEYDNTGSLPHVSKLIDGKLPQLIVMDRNGRVLANGIQSTAPNALRQLDALLKSPAR